MGLPKRAKTRGCECVEQVNKLLAPDNAKVSQSLQMNFQTGEASMSPPLIVLEKLNSKIRKRLPVLVCAHCPFCGRKLRE